MKLSPNLRTVQNEMERITQELELYKLLDFLSDNLLHFSTTLETLFIHIIWSQGTKAKATARTKNKCTIYDSGPSPPKVSLYVGTIRGNFFFLSNYAGQDSCIATRTLDTHIFPTLNVPGF